MNEVSGRRAVGQEDIHLHGDLVGTIPASARHDLTDAQRAPLTGWAGRAAGSPRSCTWPSSRAKILSLVVTAGQRVDSPPGPVPPGPVPPGPVPPGPVPPGPVPPGPVPPGPGVPPGSRGSRAGSSPCPGPGSGCCDTGTSLSFGIMIFALLIFEYYSDQLTLSCPDMLTLRLHFPAPQNGYFEP